MNIGIKDVLQRVSFFFMLYLNLLVSCLIIKFMFIREDIYFTVNARHHQWADIFFKYFTNIGDGLTTVVICIILSLFFSYRKAFLLVTSYAVSSITAQVLKHWFDMPRPKLYFGKQLDHIHFIDGVHVYSNHSFPSGHSVTAFSTAIVLTYFMKDKRWGILFFALALLAGYSRMYLSQHFFEDVVAGSVIGFVITILWLSWLDNKPFLHSEKWARRAI
ncbi:MAG: phosphatase PAP2 family protein [Sphingobacteriaceae bacterium]|nr:MAG: phosphatase PAP2 family protein [Sphingobacteriaceae bacterium]